LVERLVRGIFYKIVDSYEIEVRNNVLELEQVLYKKYPNSKI